MMAKPQSNPIYINDADMLSQFIQDFKETPVSFENANPSNTQLPDTLNSDVTTSVKYMEICRKISKQQLKSIYFELDDLEEWLMQKGHMTILVESIYNNSMRYILILQMLFDQFIKFVSEYNFTDFQEIPRIQVALDNYETDEATGKPLLLTSELNLVPPQKVRDNPISLRSVKASSIGRLITINAIVTRVTEVRPMVVVATYSCDKCGIEVYQMINSQTYYPLKECPNKACQQNSSCGILQFQSRASKFIKYQEIRIQELASQVQVGRIPQTNRVKLFGELTRVCSPGDIVNVHAIFLPIANQGYKAIKFGPVAGTYLMGQGIEQHKIRHFQNNHLDSLNSIGKETLEKLEEFVKSDYESRYEVLAQSIAPEIFGHEDVKKSLLLQMISGLTQVMEDGMKIRGDINICLVGDPGVAKSQLLKHISTIAPRAVYTSGKGSTGVGLTAAILKDPNTNEFVLEGGSLAIADMGICCIDEFDKMNDCDRTSIHEVMEQQTISISKAGINTILNARTAILAAANPAWGRYNVKRSPAENINFPASLLSRFDLLFIMLDKPNSEHDLQLAMHVIHVHRFGKNPVSSSFPSLDPELIRAYVLMAKGYTPYVTEDVRDYIVNAYLEMRQEHNEFGEYFYTTARSLLAILRLSQALCKLRFSTKISRMDVEESIRLISNSRNSILDEKITWLSKQKPVDEVSSIYNIIRNLAKQNNTNDLLYDDVASTVLLKGYTEELLNKVLDVYDQLGGVWTVSSNRRLISIIT